MSLLTRTMWRWTVSWTFQRAQMKTERCFDLPPVIFHGFEPLFSPPPCHTLTKSRLCAQTVTLYLVKWCSLPYEDSTWELKADIEQSKIEEFEHIAARTPNTKRVVSSPCARVCAGAISVPALLVAVCVCVFVCVGLLPAPSSRRFKAPLMLSSGPSSCGLTHSHTHALLLWPVQTTNCVFNAEQK